MAEKRKLDTKDICTGEENIKIFKKDEILDFQESKDVFNKDVNSEDCESERTEKITNVDKHIGTKDEDLEQKEDTAERTEKITNVDKHIGTKDEDLKQKEDTAEFLEDKEKFELLETLTSSSTEILNNGKTEPGYLDPMSYTKADEFTSEIFKIQIHNLPKFGFNDLKKRLRSSLHLNPHKIKSDKRYVTYVCFRNETDRDEALRKINGHVWKGKTLHAKIAAPVADPFLQKKKNEKEGGEKSVDSATEKYPPKPSPECHQLTPQEAEARLRANIIPLWDTEYSQQLQIKTAKIKDVLQRVARNNFVRHMFKDKSQHNEMVCELLPIVPSPVTSEYRNKNEFTVGYGLDGQTVMVGFRYGMYKDGITAVGDSTCLGVVMPTAIPVVKSFNKFVSKSKLLPYRQETATGHWQTLTVRTFRTGDVMAMIDFVPRKLDQSEITSAKDSLKEFYTCGEGKDVVIKSFYFRIMGSKGQSIKSELGLLFGEPHVYESILGLKFRISPEAFFQVNTIATEKLYQLIADWCNASSSATVLDLCCGTGTIGLSMAKRVKQVVGIEMCQPAVDDAKFNASINGITNATFHCAKVEDVISKIMSSLQSASSSDDVVAVVDPPRPGLHKDVIKTLRKCSQLQHLVYVSCNPDSAMDNFIDLIRPETGRHKGAPFQMMKAIPVDLFPGTKHCELIILFTRKESNSEGDSSTKDANTPAGEECDSNKVAMKDTEVESTG